jgi:hypothetical protein
LVGNDVITNLLSVPFRDDGGLQHVEVASPSASFFIHYVAVSECIDTALRWLPIRGTFNFLILCATCFLVFFSFSCRIHISLWRPIGKGALFGAALAGVTSS